jgi:hypothetical protein
MSGITIPEFVPVLGSPFIRTLSDRGAILTGALCDISAEDNDEEGFNGKANPIVTNVKNKKVEVDDTIVINLNVYFISAENFWIKL